MNDKPWGVHATPVSYLKVALVSLAAATIANLVANCGRQPKYARYALCGFAAVIIVTASFSLWNRWAFEEKNAHTNGISNRSLYNWMRTVSSIGSGLHPSVHAYQSLRLSGMPLTPPSGFTKSTWNKLPRELRTPSAAPAM